MYQPTTATVAIVLALAGEAAFADDSSMSQWTGESYGAFEADRTNRSAVVSVYAPANLNAMPDNSTSRWNGDSYVAFEHARTNPATVTMSIAEANKARAVLNHDVPARSAIRGRSPVNPFRNDTAA